VCINHRWSGKKGVKLDNQKGLTATPSKKIIKQTSRTYDETILLHSLLDHILPFIMQRHDESAWSTTTAGRTTNSS
jgi:hypothetical protein